jgi:hypothetical protein
MPAHRLAARLHHLPFEPAPGGGMDGMDGMDF